MVTYNNYYFGFIEFSFKIKKHICVKIYFFLWYFLMMTTTLKRFTFTIISCVIKKQKNSTKTEKNWVKLKAYLT